jgi:hypothetical protein
MIEEGERGEVEVLRFLRFLDLRIPHKSDSERVMMDIGSPVTGNPVKVYRVSCIDFYTCIFSFYTPLAFTGRLFYISIILQAAAIKFLF